MATSAPEGTLNFREVEGLPTMDGRRVRRGVLYRSDTLQFLSVEDAALLVKGMGVQTVIDLRLPYEVRIEGRGLLAEFPHNYHHLPFQVAGAEQAGSAVPRLQAEDPMTRHYLGYLSTSPAAVTGVVRALIDDPVEATLPAVVHCTAGKDRTGVAVAMLLSSIGVAPEDVAAEYAVGSSVLPAVFERLRTMATYGDKVDSMPPESRVSEARDMRRFLDAVDTEYGGVRGYLRSHGVSDDALAILRDRLTEPVGELATKGH